MAWKIFKGKEKTDDQLMNDFKLKIDGALRNAQNDKRDALNKEVINWFNNRL